MWQFLTSYEIISFDENSIPSGMRHTGPTNLLPHGRVTPPALIHGKGYLEVTDPAEFIVENPRH